MKKILLITGISSVICVGLVLFIIQKQRVTTNQEKRGNILLGTVCEITIIHESKEFREQLFEAAFDLIEEMEQRLSIYKEDSEVSHINADGYEHDVAVSDDTYFLLEQSKSLSLISEKAFDITMLPLSRLWGFMQGDKHMPSDSDIQEVLPYLGSDNIELRQEGDKKYVRLANDIVNVDLGGVAKGYICDLVASLLRTNGIENALVNIGGTIFSLGAPENKNFWSVGIRDPREKEHVVTSVPLRNEAISTSGDYEQFFMNEGKRFSHILDPRTGRPATSVISVSVRAPSAMVADALSTALFVLGPAQGMILINKLNGIECYIVYSEHGALQVRTSTTFFD